MGFTYQPTSGLAQDLNIAGGSQVLPEETGGTPAFYASAVFSQEHYMEVSLNSGTPKWVVYNRRENLLK